MIFNPYFKTSEDVVKFEPKSFKEIIALLKGVHMLACPKCGSTHFITVISTLTKLSRATFSDEFGVVSGTEENQESRITSLVCSACGAEQNLDSLAKVKFCHECGRPLGKVYRKHTTGYLYHMDCALNCFPENETTIVYDA
jgi:predicted RNA-binding Zn-ribbon protein involved in translation (DUF1610 family)